MRSVGFFFFCHFIFCWTKTHGICIPTSVRREKKYAVELQPKYSARAAYYFRIALINCERTALFVSNFQS